MIIRLTNGLAALGLFLALALSGCYAGAVGTALGLLELSRDDGGGVPPDVPRVVNLKVVDNPPGAGRATDLNRVTLTLDLFERTAEPAAVTVEFAVSSADGTGSEFLPASILEATETLSTSDKGETHELTWDAGADGLRGFVEKASLRVTPRDDDGEGAQVIVEPISLGNTPPVATGVEVRGGGVASRDVIIQFRLSDEAGDLSTIDFLYSKDGGGSFQAVPEGHIVGGQITDLPTSAPGHSHDLIWDSLATLRAEDLENVVIAIRPTDGLPGGAGLMVESEPFCVRNSTPPQITLYPPSLIPDSDGAVPLRFFLHDDEGDPADVVLQWSTERDSFPDIRDLQGEGVRRSILADPDARALRQIVTPRLRTILEARCRVLAGESAAEVLLTGTSPPAAFTDATFAGATLELLSDAGVVEQTRRVTGTNPGLRRLLLERELTPPPRQGQRVRLKESVAHVFFDLRSSRTGRAVEHVVAWDVPADVGVRDRNERYFIRATPFARSHPGASSASAVGKAVTTYWLGFVPASPLATGAGLLRVREADLNGDGHLDLVSVDSEADQLSLFLGRGDGSFTRPDPPTLRTGRFPRFVEAGDLNGDGHLDLVSADTFSDQLSIFPGQGDGSFTRAAELTLTTGLQPRWVEIADIDGDGHLDLISADILSIWLSLFLGRGDGSFRRPEEEPTLGSEDFPRTVEAADLNGDDHLDLISASLFSLWIFLGRGEGKFTGPHALAGGARWATAADLNGDGHLDLVSVDDDASDHLSIFLGQGDGSFELVTPESGGGTSVVVADLNGDGHLDLVSGEILLGRGYGSFVRPAESTLPAGHPRVADLNGDDHHDLVSVDSDSDQVLIFLSRGEVSFTRPSTLETLDDPMSVVAADLDADGRLDLVCPARGSHSLSIFLGGGDRRFTRVAALETGERPVAVEVADVDADGYLDLVSADLGPDQLSVFLGRGHGSFTEAEVALETGVDPVWVEAADLDADGRLDLVSADSGSDQVSIFLRQRDGGFVFTRPEAPTVETGESPVFVEAADLDRDGHLDLVSADSESDQLSVFLGRGSGQFTVAGALTTGVRPESLAVADLDADGHLDLVSADSVSDQLSIFFGRGDGSFAPGIALETGDFPRSVEAGDLDGDGHLDLVSADSNSRRLSIFLGRGDGSFTRPGVLTLETGAFPRSVEAADLDGDGHLDLVSADWPVGSDQLSIFFNTGSKPVPSSFFGTPRTDSPTTGDGRGGELVLRTREDPYRINSSSGTIDGVRSPAFQGRAFHFASIAIEPGARVIAAGEDPLVLLATGDVVIAGELLGDGASAEAAESRPGGNGNSGSAGGTGGPGGARGGDGGGTHPGSGTVHGRRGGGPGGGGGGRLSGGAPASGGGGGHAGPGQGIGGSAYGNDLLEPLFGGSGGGGGSICDGGFGPAGVLNNGDPEGNGGDLGGGGGGGGGGALRITAGGDITVTESGTISADGGDGGRGKENKANWAGPGGGGAGGSILLQAYGHIKILSGATVSAVGGRGASGSERESPRGGDGSDGRIRCEDSDGALENRGAFRPGAHLGRLRERMHAVSCAAR